MHDERIGAAVWIPGMTAIAVAVVTAGWILYAAWLARAMHWDGDGDDQDALALLAPIETVVRTASRPWPRS